MTVPWNLRSSMRSALAATALIGALAAVPAARADVYTLRIGSGHAPTALYVVLMRDFFVPEVKRRVAERTKHTVNFTEAYGGSIVKVNETLRGVQDGIIVEVAREYEAMNGKRFDEQYQKAVAGLKAAGARVETLPPSVRAAWAQALKYLPAKRAKEMDAMGLPGSRTLQIAIEESEKAGYNWPVRYLLK